VRGCRADARGFVGPPAHEQRAGAHRSQEAVQQRLLLGDPGVEPEHRGVDGHGVLPQVAVDRRGVEAGQDAVGRCGPAVIVQVLIHVESAMKLSPQVFQDRERVGRGVVGDDDALDLRPVLGDQRPRVLGLLVRESELGEPLVLVRARPFSRPDPGLRPVDQPLEGAEQDGLGVRGRAPRRRDRDEVLRRRGRGERGQKLLLRPVDSGDGRADDHAGEREGSGGGAL
jgi:hypothetical protein